MNPHDPTYPELFVVCLDPFNFMLNFSSSIPFAL